MNYKRIYDELIFRGKNREITCYYERHHIIPKCLGGTDDKENIVKLTPEEHYVAHQLLVKIYPTNHAIAKAAAMMIPNRPTNKMYGWVRRRFAAAKSTEQSGSGNSQFGSRWAHNPLTKESKKIKGELREGWVYGKYKEPKTKINKLEILLEKRADNKKKQIAIHKEYYNIYKVVGFEKFVEITGYKKSKQNLVQRFASLLDEFVPQNGKKRKS